MSNIFSRAKILRKKHPNKSWKDLVKMAGSEQKKVSSPINNNSMATTKKRKAPAKKRRVAGVTTTKKTVTKRRRSVGSIIDANMIQIAGGLALTSVAEGFLAPLKNKIPANLQKFADPVVAILAYKGSTYFKNPIAKGVCLGLMKSGVDGTVKVITGAMGMRQNMAPAPPAAAANMQNMNMGDIYIPLPSPSLGEIRAFLGAADSQNPLASMSNMGAVEEPYLPLGWDA